MTAVHRSLVRVLAVVLAGGTLVAASGHATATAVVRDHDGAGITVLRDEQISDRLHELTVRSDALEGAESHLRVLLPADYDPDADREYTTVWLAHARGTNDEKYRSFTENFQLEAFTADLDAILIMPAAGAFGFYTDWYNNGAGGQPKWESFHIGELVEWSSHYYRACSRRSCRVILGVSVGGFGALSYAARHPDLFVAAAAISAPVDTNVLGEAGGTGVSALQPALGEAPIGSWWGQYATEEVRWRGDNPVDLAVNLTDTALQLRTGNGLPGGEFGGDLDPMEVAVHEMMVSMHDELERLGIEHVWDDYGPGAHTPAYFERSLFASLPPLLQVAGEDRPDPQRFTVRFLEDVREVWAWRIEFQRDVLEFAELRDASSDGFTLAGSGLATVTTAPYYRPGEVLDIVIDDVATTAVADTTGRLVVDLDLGPSSAFQQYTAAAKAEEMATGRPARAVTVEVAAEGGRAPIAPGPESAATGLPSTGGGGVFLALLLVLAGRVSARRSPA